jgi:hypothetical protein
MSEGKIMLGTPPPAMFPARNYAFEIKQEHFVISIPRSGNYHEIDPEFFPEDAGAFDILDEENKVLYMPAITKVLFATKQYPALGPNQFFVPYVLAFKEETVDIVGQLVEFKPQEWGEDGGSNDEVL